MRLHFSFFLLKIYFFRNKTNEFHIKYKDHVAKINYMVELNSELTLNKGVMFLITF